MAIGQSNGVLREVYTGISGVTVADLTNSANFPANPTFEEVVTAGFEAPTDVDENYGQRMTAYVTAPTTGNYVFWIASDDYSTLYLSTDDTPANKRVIASVPGWTSSREWTKYSQQQSGSIALVGGRRYYIEALMKEGNGGDNLAVRWRLPAGTIEEPIPNSRLQVFGLGPPQIIRQPADLTTIEGASATFSVQLSRSTGASYQWLRGGANIPGATNSSYTLAPVSLSDSGAQFRCFISNSQGSTNSSTATLTVQADTTPPAITSVVTLGDNRLVTVVFSEPVETASGTNPLNYSIDNGVSTSAAAFGADSRSVVLTTSPLNAGTTYTLTVNNVRDRATAPNPIAANSQRTFTLDFTPLDITSVRPGAEPIGPSSRRTGLAFSEIMYHPADRVDGKNLEFIEIYNSQPFFEDLSGYRLTGTVEYTFPTNTTLAGRSYLVVAPSPADVQSIYGIASVLGGFTNKLSNGSGSVRLRNKQNAILLEVNYSGDPPWPAAADGAGHSLVLARPSFGEGDPRAWDASDAIGGTPGAGETPAVNPYLSILINEFLAHTDDPAVDYIELYNYSAQEVNLAGCVLTDDPSTNKFVVPSGVTIPPRGFLVYNQTNMGFSLSADGETIYLLNPAGNKVLDAVRFGGQENGLAIGRYPDGAPNFYRLQATTPGGPNAKVRPSEVVINEIMFHPISGDADDEFVELYNRTATPLSLSGWRLRGGISFTFPPHALIPANGYVVVANNVAHLITNYASLNTNNTFGNYGGALGNRGDRIALSKPDQIISTNNGVVVTNTIHIVLNEVAYGEGGRWGKWSDGGGSSLELIDPESDNRFPSNWGDSDETAKGAWSNIEFTGVLDNGNGGYPADTLHVGLLGIGECLIDNVEVVPAGGGNVVPNPTFEGGLSGWVLQGSHSESTLETSGYNSSRSLRIRAESRCDTGANRIRTALSSTLADGSTATLRAKFRWLRGSPEPLLRLKGNWLEATGRMAVPSNLGTPGMANSRKVVNAGPVLHHVAHSPVLPAVGQAVTIVAQVGDPNGLASLVVKYRVDPSTNVNSVSMSYNGAGLYSGQLPGQPAGSVVAFYLEAADHFAPSAVSRFPDDAPARECLIRYGEPQPSGTLGTYRLWLSSKTIARWTAREKLNNTPLDATFVYNNYRVIYNAGSLYSGSPFHMGAWSGPTNGLCDYVLNLPADDLFLGNMDAVLASVGNLDNDDTTQREQAAYWIMNKLDVPFNYRRFIRMYVNGVQRGRVFEDAQQPNSDLVDQWFPDDSDGDLHKIEDWFEFNDGATSFSNTDATLQNFTTGGGQKKLARYRWIWRKRATDSPSAYTNLFSLVDAVNSPTPQPYTTLVDSLVDSEEWMRVIAVEHIVGNWDSYGYNRGKNMYGYKPQNGKWNLFAWDIDFVLGSGSDGTSTDINPLTMPLNDPVLRTMFSTPPYQRAFWRALEDAVNGPLVAGNINPILDAKHSALVANNISATSPSSALKSWIQSRRTYLLNQLATVAASFTITSNGGGDFSTNRNYISLAGTAPIGVKTIRINGIAYPVTWSSLTSWTLNYALAPGLNSLTVAGHDLRGNPIAGLSDTIAVTYTGTTEQAQDFLVINEIMYNPAVPDTAFIEIYNRSTVTAFDLSHFRINGADFAFAEGTIVQPGGFLVVVNDPIAFTATYGPSIPIAGVFNGKLKNSGETLKLIRPGLTADQDLTLDQVTYDSLPPWPTAANGFGPSLQLIDPAQDNNRVANWAAATTNSTTAPQWQFVIATGTASSSRVYIYLDGAGDVYLDDLKLVAGSVPDVGSSYVNNGDFESAFPGPWNVSANLSGSATGAAIKHSGNFSLHVVSTSTGSGQGTSIWQDTSPLVNGNPYTLSFWYLPSTNANTLTIRLSGSGIRVDQNVRFNPASTSTQYTPGAPNSVRANLAAFPLVWLNEIQPNNVAGVQDNFGDPDPWVELYNSSSSPLDLTGFYLSDNYTNLTRWALPGGALLNPGQFQLVWLDNEPGETSGANWHASFRASPTNGSIVLTRVSGGVSSVVDYLNYAPVNNDRSYGAYPDGTPAKRQVFYFATPRAANDPAYPATPVFVNEWMAGNTGTLVDAADGKFDDWFELYNSGPAAVDLSGYTLTDDLGNTNNWTIPNGTMIPTGGYLLVWADGETEQNGYGGSDLHAGFRLNLGGEALGLFAPNGALVDSVTFGAQTNDVSQGRWPDGNSSLYFMTAPTPRSANSIGLSSNSPPVLAAIGDNSGREDTLISFTAAATDPNPDQALGFSLDPGAPKGAAINPTSGVFTWTPTESQGPGVYSVTVRVTDSGSPALSDFQTFSITVTEVNSPPSLTFISDKAVSEGALLSFTATATDVDLPAQVLTFSLDPGAPPGATIDSTSGSFSWTPTPAQGPSTNVVTIRATDNGSPNLSTAETFNIIVQETNSPPVLAPLENQLASEGALLSLTISATDPDEPAQTLTYGMDPGAPAGANFDAATHRFTWTPTEAQGPGGYTVTFRVRDSGSPALEDFETISIVVGEMNQPPLLAAISDQTVPEGSTLTFTSSASDPDVPANTLSYSLDPGAPTGARVDPTTGVFAWMPTEAQGPGTYTLTVRVTDGGSPSLDDAKSFTVIVTEVNIAPVLDAIADQIATAGTQLSLNASATDADLPANALTFSLEPGAPFGTTLDPQTGLFTWTPAASQAPSTNMIAVSVTDIGSPPLSDTKVFTVRVSPAATLKLTNINVVGGLVALTWDSVPGKQYRVQYLDDVGSTIWNLAGDYTASGTSTTATNNPAGSSQRYYRVVQLN